MPNRWTSLLIVAFWIMMMSWLTFKEVKPRLPGMKPRMHSALAASVNDGPTHWTIVHNGEKLGEAYSSVTLKDDGTYELHQWAQFDLNQYLGKAFNWLQIDQVLGKSLNFSNRATCSRAGDILEFTWHIKLGESDLGDWKIKGRQEGNELILSVDGLFVGGNYRIKHDNKGHVLNSLVPIDRLPDLWLGRRWETLMFHPIGATQPTSALEQKPAEVVVRNQLDELLWADAKVPCFLVEAQQSDWCVKLWVREEDGLVLKQAANWGATSLELVRDHRKKRFGR